MSNQTYTPDWSKAPPQANWWARDKDGSGFWYSKRPSAQRYSFVADVDFVAADNDCPFIDCSFELDNWRDTLTARPCQPSDIPQSLSDYFFGKTSFITAYADLLLARMAKDERFSDDSYIIPSLEVTAFDVITFLSYEGEKCYGMVTNIENVDAPSGWLGVTYCATLSYGFWKYASDNSLDVKANPYIRTITSDEAAEFKMAMGVVYG